MPNGNARTQVFVSYSHRDLACREHIRAALAPDIRNERIEYWDDQAIEAGDAWRESIAAAIDRARVALLVITPDFFRSEFIRDVEIPRIQQAAAEGLTVLWLPAAGPCVGEGRMPELALVDQWQAVCDPATPLLELDDAGKADVALELARRVRSLLGTRRFVGNLPFGSLGDLFMGRQDAFAAIESRLERGGSSAIVQPKAISGLGGVGKTRLAIEYAWRYQKRYLAVLFVTANEPDDLRANLAALSRPDVLDLPEYRFGNEEDRHDAVIRWLQENAEWLLIIDNVDTPDAVSATQRLAARLTGGHVIITSRITQWGRGVEQLSLDVIAPDDATRLLLEATRDNRESEGAATDSRVAGELAARLGHLPLALTHAAAYIGYHQISLAQYATDLDESLPRLLAYHDDSVIEYDAEPEKGRVRKTIATTFFLSFGELGPTEKAILQASSFLAPEPIPQGLFEAGADELSSLRDLWCEENDEQGDERPARDALAELARYSLVTRERGQFRVHRMEQEVLRARVPADREAAWIEGVRAIVRAFSPPESPENPHTWETWAALRAHAEELVEVSEDDERIPPDLALIRALAAYYYGQGDYNLSLAMEERAIAAVERHHGAESEEMADRLINYGESLRVLDRIAEAEAVFRRCLELRESAPFPDDLEVASTLNYLALTIQDAHKDEAEAYYRRVLAIYDHHGDLTDPTDLGKVLVNLGALVAEMDGGLDEAESLLTRAVTVTTDGGAKKIRPQLAMICRFQLASVKANRGAKREAARLYSDAFDLACVFPPGHPYRNTATDGYAGFLCSDHRLGEARRVYETSGQGGEREGPKVRSKLRLLEVLLDLDDADDVKPGTGDPLVEQALHPEGIEPYVPARLVGITFRDLSRLQCTFSFDTGHEPEDRSHVGRLVECFNTAVAAAEHVQWAGPTACGKGIEDTWIGVELQQQAIHLRTLLARLVAPGTPAREALDGTARIEVWVRPNGGRVYTSKVDEQTDEKVDGQVHILDAPLELAWECHSSQPPDADLVIRGNAAFAAHVAPILRSAIDDSKLFAPLRQVHDCMFLATWFKGNFRWHKAVERYLETGNTDQWNMNLDHDDEIEFGGKAIQIPHIAALDLNQRALDLRQAGRPAEAETLLREALELEERAYPPGFPKIPHRLNNLASVLLMQGKLDGARRALERAWSLTRERRNLTTARVLFTRVLLALLEREDDAFFVGQLKSIFDGPRLTAPMNISDVADYRPILDHLTDEAVRSRRAFLDALVAALNGPHALEALDLHDGWVDSPPVDWRHDWPAGE